MRKSLINNLLTLAFLLAVLPVSLGSASVSPARGQSAFDCGNVTEIPQTECEALVALYDATCVDESCTGWSDWLVENTPCSWVGIACEDGHVTRLNGIMVFLTGSLPAELGDLTALTYLNLSVNSLSGPIPSAIGDLTALTYLNLAYNGLSGALPSSLTSLRQLRQFYFQYTNLCVPPTGPVPEWLSGIPDVQGKDLVCGTVSGQVTDASGTGIEAVTVSAGAAGSAVTDAQGTYTIEGLANGNYTLKPRRPGWILSPSSRTITLSWTATGQDFTGYPCVGPSGLDFCQLEAGDIILSRSPLTGAIFGIGGTYFTHAMVFSGEPPAYSPFVLDPRLVEAQGYVSPEADQVWETSLFAHKIWTGPSILDWAVVRPRVDESVKLAAVSHARDKAAEAGVVFDLFANREDNKRFYCSKLVWRSYRDVPGGVDLEANRGVGSRLLDYWVTPDDLYFSSAEVDSADLEMAGGRFRTTLWSPGHVTLVDTQGRRAGYDTETGDAVFEIPGADYCAAPEAEVETITAVGVGEGWQIIVTGYGSGEYLLESMYMDRNTMVNVRKGTTEIGQTDVYDVESPMYGIYLPFASH